ncbi:MAG: hypothetical protein HYV27_22310 [Candidatus Hydrogenedentes bacterium]|nr:hypothetical protein [Candidatus Hydrogenedentota bacterium]
MSKVSSEIDGSWIVGMQFSKNDTLYFLWNSAKIDFVFADESGYLVATREPSTLCEMTDELSERFPNRLDDIRRFDITNLMQQLRSNPDHRDGILIDVCNLCSDFLSSISSTEFEQIGEYLGAISRVTLALRDEDVLREEQIYKKLTKVEALSIAIGIIVTNSKVV